MIEGSLLQVSAHVHFDLCAVVRADGVNDDLEDQKHEINDGENAQPVKLAVGDVVVDGVFLEFREHKVDDRTQKGQEYHQKHHNAVGLYERKDLGDSEEFEMSCFLFCVFHHSSTSSFSSSPED